jgi:protein TonB
MNTASSSSFQGSSGPGTWLSERAGPLGAIIVLHVALLFALRTGSVHETVQSTPREVSVSFITPEPVPAPPKPQPLPPRPKTVPVVKKAVRPPVPVVKNEPAPQAITAPPAPPEPAAPAIPAAPVPSAPAAPPAPPAPPQPRTITSGIQYLQEPEPVYPSISKRIGEEGKAVLRVLVNDKGHPERVEIQQSSGFARLDEAARKAVLRALFKPFIEDGKAVAAYAVIPIRFQLDN